MFWLQFTRSNAVLIPIIQMLFTGVALGALISGQYTAQQWWIPILVYFCTGCLGITMTFHRFLTHRSFDMRRGWEMLFSILGSLGGTGSPLGWKTVHIDHHKYADTERDPHSPIHGKWTVLFGAYQVEFNKWAVRDLINDRFHRYLHDYYNVLLLAWAGLLALISVDALILGFIIPVAIQIWVSNLSNYFNHAPGHGYRNFNTKDNSRNVWWLALIAWAEGWHNLHHKYPWCAKFGLRDWEFDITYWMICVFGSNPNLLGEVHKAKQI